MHLRQNKLWLVLAKYMNLLRHKLSPVQVNRAPVPARDSPKFYRVQIRNDVLHLTKVLG